MDSICWLSPVVLQSYLSVDVSGKEDLFCLLYHLLSHTESCPTGCTVGGWGSVFDVMV